MIIRVKSETKRKNDGTGNRSKRRNTLSYVDSERNEDENGTIHLIKYLFM